MQKTVPIKPKRNHFQFFDFIPSIEPIKKAAIAPIAKKLTKENIKPKNMKKPILSDVLRVTFELTKKNDIINPVNNPSRIMIFVYTSSPYYL